MGSAAGAIICACHCGISGGDAGQVTVYDSAGTVGAALSPISPLALPPPHAKAAWLSMETAKRKTATTAKNFILDIVCSPLSFTYNSNYVIM